MVTKTTPWLKIKAEYLQGITPKELAKKYNIKAKAISDKANELKWVAEKSKISENIRKNTEDIVKEITELALKRLQDILNNDEIPAIVTVQAIGKAIDISGLKNSKQEITGKNGEPFSVKKIFITPEKMALMDNMIDDAING